MSDRGVDEIRVSMALHPRQLDFVTSEARFSFYVGGVGAGKTFAGAMKAIRWAGQHPGSLGVIGAPTYPMLRDATQRTVFELLPPGMVRDFSKSEQRLTLLTDGGGPDSEILFRSLDQPDRTRGLNLGWFWLDEAPLCGYYAWTILKARLRQTGQVTAAWATGTPHGRDGYARDFELARRRDHALYRASTRDNQANLPPHFIEDLGYTGQFAEQEIEGRFVAFDGLVYSLDTVSAPPLGHLRSWSQDEPPGRVVGGVDWGYTNPCAAVVVGLDGDARAWALDEFYQRRAGLDEVIIPAIVGLTRQYGVALWYCDGEDPEAVARLDAALVALGREGVTSRARPVKKGAGSVRAGIQTVTRLLAPRRDGTRGLYVDPRCVNLIREFETYAYATRNGERRDASEEPVKQNDHGLDALRYVAHSELGAHGSPDAYLEAMTQALRARADAADAAADVSDEQVVFRAYSRANRRIMSHGHAGD